MSNGEQRARWDELVHSGRDVDWMEQGLCSRPRPIGEGDNWFPDADDWRSGLAMDVIAVCSACPVREQCLDYAMQLEGSGGETHRYGIWGGLTPGQRARLFQGADEQPRESRDTHCAAGHEMTPENTRHRTRKRAGGLVYHHDSCRECERVYARKRHEERRAEREAS